MVFKRMQPRAKQHESPLPSPFPSEKGELVHDRIVQLEERLTQIRQEMPILMRSIGAGGLSIEARSEKEARLAELRSEEEDITAVLGNGVEKKTGTNG